MKLNILTVAAAAAMLGLGACNSNSLPKPTADSPEQLMELTLEKCTTFEDSLAQGAGAFAGVIFNAQSLNDSTIDRAELLRGIRDVLKNDTTNNSYLLGLQMGSQAMNLYRDLAKSEKISKDAFLKALTEGLALDSVDFQKAQVAQQIFGDLSNRAQQRAAEKAEKAALESAEGKANVKAAQAYVAKLQADSAYKDLGNGIYAKTITAGSGDTFKPQARCNVKFTMKTLDGQEVFSMSEPRITYVAQPGLDALAAVLPLMKAGETTEFYVPYEMAFGAQGNANLKVGACQSLVMVVTATAIEEKSEKK